MKPVDFRNATWEEMQGRLAGMRMTVLEAWRKHGPGTTREIAQRSGIDLLQLRPRTTELVELGFVELIGDERGTEGIYRARSYAEAQKLFNQHKREATLGYQPELKL